MPLADALGQLPDLWHVHNHSLGKNPGLTQAIAQLAKEESPYAFTTS